MKHKNMLLAALAAVALTVAIPATAADGPQGKGNGQRKQLRDGSGANCQGAGRQGGGAGSGVKKQDRKRDGTGENCKNGGSGGSGNCDGTGPKRDGSGAQSKQFN
jgi:hypothetical protein